MAYIPTEWETGDVITAAKLNNMEQGIEDAFVAPAVTISDEGNVLTVNSSGEWAAESPVSYDKTFIYNLAVDAGTGEFSITLDASSPIPAVNDFSRPERNRVKLVAPANMIAGIGYVAFFLPFTMELDVSVDRDQMNYIYSLTGGLGGSLGNFAVTFYPYNGSVTATVAVVLGE